MAAVRQRDGSDAGVSRRVRRRGIDHLPARATSASGVLSSDSDANPTQSQAASWHPSQFHADWFVRGSGRDADTDAEARGRSQQEPAAMANAPPVAESQSAAHMRGLMSQAAGQASGQGGDPASQRPGHDVPVTGVSAEVGVPSDAPRRLTRSLTRHAHRLARADDGAAMDNAAVDPTGEGALAAQQGGAAQPLLQHSRLSSHGSLADGDLPSSQGPDGAQHAADSQRTGGSGSAAPPSAAAAQGGAPGCTAATGVQRITRFFAPLTALMGAHGSQQQLSQAATVAATADVGPPPQGQEDEVVDGTAPNEVTSAERRMASQPAASQRDRGPADASPSRVPPSQLAFPDREGVQPSQLSMGRDPAAVGPALLSSGIESRAAAALVDTGFAPPSHHLPMPGQAPPEVVQDTEGIPQAASGTAAYGVVSGAPPVSRRTLDLRRNLGYIDYVESMPLDLLEGLWAAEDKELEEAAHWDTDLELSHFEVRVSLPFCYSGDHSSVTFTR